MALLACVCATARGRATPAPSQRLRRDTDFAKSAVAGGVAAAAATVVFHPVDTVKTVLQQGGVGGVTGVAAVRAIGKRGLYRGVLPAAFSMLPACAVRMGSYEAMKSALLQHAPPSLSPGVLIFAASALSVVASASVRAPLDMIKTRVQADASMSAARAIRLAWAGGVGSLYRGAGLGLMRDVPFFGVNLLLYEQLKAAAAERKTHRPHDGPAPQLTPFELVLIGAAAQGVAGLLTNPADVLKTRVQSGAAQSIGAALHMHGGWAGLMRGAGMRVAWIAPQGSIYYPAYEATQRLLGGGT